MANIADDGSSKGILLSQEEMDKILCDVRSTSTEQSKDVGVPELTLSQGELDALFSNAPKQPEKKAFERPKLISVVMGHAKWTAADKEKFLAGTPQELDSLAGAPVEIMEDGHLLAKATISQINGHYAIILCKDDE
ncbi:MAG: hypothetical protein K6E51_00330 [Treponema sp.]|nr:hypothetical protein [Treponema sp.]